MFAMAFRSSSQRAGSNFAAAADSTSFWASSFWPVLARAKARKK
jgi:hypothetical protein